jgi:hypothetical protein
MFRKISRDVEIAALNLHENGQINIPPNRQSSMQK